MLTDPWKVKGDTFGTDSNVTQDWITCLCLVIWHPKTQRFKLTGLMKVRSCFIKYGNVHQ
jgi:hypothetical protein